MKGTTNQTTETTEKILSYYFKQKGLHKVYNLKEFEFTEGQGRQCFISC